MLCTRPQVHQQGFSLVEVVVVSALLLLVFGGLFAGARLMIELVGHSKAESGARSLAVAKLEYIRSLDYDDVGTVGGIPAGPLPQTSTTTLNGITYTERILVQYKDRPEDGFGADDENGITEDSKVAKVEYTWTIRGNERSLVLTTDLIPRGIESTSGGGTLFINVFDSAVQPVDGASVHVYNDTGTSTIDVTVTTNANGIANFPGAPARSGYQVTATKDGYSTDQTYSATPSNPNPNPPHVSVIEGEVSTVNFAIDLLSDLTIRTVEPAVTGTLTDTFDDTSQLYELDSTTVSGGSLVLAGGAGSYASSGTARGTSSSPALLDSWQAVDFTGSAPTDTTLAVQVYDVTGSGTSTSYTLVSDTDLPGNSTGFTAGPIDISGLDTAAHPSLALGATLTSSDVNVTPSLEEWEISHIETQQPISGVTVDLVGAKTIGDNDGTPVPKYSGSVTTDGDGDGLLTDLEWDVYDITVDGAIEGYDIIEAYGLLPYALDPGVAETLTLVLDTYTTNSLRVTVTDQDNTFIEGAEVELARTGFSETTDTSIYGQVFFGGLTAASDYTLTITASGYEQYSQSSFAVDGTDTLHVKLTPSS